MATIHGRIHVKGGEKEATVMIGVPFTHRGQLVAEERILSGTLSFNLLREGPDQIGVWSGHISSEGEVIGYSATIKVQPQHLLKSKPPALGPYPGHWRGGTETGKTAGGKMGHPSAGGSISKNRRGSERDFWAPPSDDQDLRAWSAFQDKHGRVTAFLVLLRAADLPARVAEGLELVESITTPTLVWIQVWTGQEWENLQPEKGEIYQKSVALLPLTTGGDPSFAHSRGNFQRSAGP